MDARRTERQLPTIDSRALYINREEDVGVIQAVVVEEVAGASQKVIGVQDPAFEGNSDTELVFFIALACQWHKIQLLALDGVESGARKRAERRRLIKAPVKAAEHPV